MPGGEQRRLIWPVGTIIMLDCGICHHQRQLTYIKLYDEFHKSVGPCLHKSNAIKKGEIYHMAAFTYL